MSERDIAVLVNGRKVSSIVSLQESLADFIRLDRLLTGTHIGCDRGTCGACTVMLDGKPVLSCLVLAVQADGCEIITIEGLQAEQGGLHPLQQCLISCGAIQCGFCTPGIVMNMIDFLGRSPSPTADRVREALLSNVCRCGDYQRIIAAVLEAAKLLQTHSKAASPAQ